MPYVVNSEADLIRVDFSGTLTRDELASMFGEVIAIERSLAIVPDRIAVFLEVTSFAVSTPEFMEHTARRRATHFSNAFKTAIVARAPVHVGMARMFQILSDHPQITVRIFETVEAASDWLRSA